MVLIWVCVVFVGIFHPLYYLEVRAGDTGCYLLEERLLDPDELRRLYHV